MLACDVTDEGSVAALVATILESHGQIDLLVHNVGLNVGLGTFGTA